MGWRCGANKPMNERLRQAWKKIDGIVERAYQQKAFFESGEERLSVLLNLYKRNDRKGRNDLKYIWN